MGKKQELKKFEQELLNSSITVSKFLMTYYGIYNDKLSIAKISHDDIKALIPDLKRVGFDYLLKNKSKLYLGEIIAVKDSYGRVVPYICPTIDYYLVPTAIELELPDCDVKIYNIINDEDLEIYELDELCKKLKNASKYREYKIVKRILGYRQSKETQKVKKYKKEKNELRLKENGKNEY